MGRKPLRPAVEDATRRPEASAATVSLAARQTPLTPKATRAAVQSAIDTVGCVDHCGAWNPGMPATQTARLAAPEIILSSCAALAAGVDEAFDQPGQVSSVPAALSHDG